MVIECIRFIVSCEDLDKEMILKVLRNNNIKSIPKTHKDIINYYCIATINEYLELKNEFNTLNVTVCITIGGTP